MQGKRLASRFIHIAQSHRQMLYSRAVFFSRSRKLGHEVCCLDEVLIGGVANQVLKGSRDQVQTDVLHNYEKVQFTAEVLSSILVRDEF